eukprot:CAMPEP_0194312672 /NCGR_PEP_ID=MMETSP0171-20130528/9607_1 /TAXON_ID=218684 /ORGANISM="Corethron pennatum, Strain L29A3" /LENGTH=326 /DNA_ID=CAMNT_0039067291 /DNA_START=45 /DNA_END=1022 /DNA_ORIENTATION=+
MEQQAIPTPTMNDLSMASVARPAPPGEEDFDEVTQSPADRRMASRRRLNDRLTPRPPPASLGLLLGAGSARLKRSASYTSAGSVGSVSSQQRRAPPRPLDGVAEDEPPRQDTDAPARHSWSPDDRPPPPSTSEPPIDLSDHIAGNDRPASPAPVSAAGHLPLPLRVTVPSNISGPQRAGVEIRFLDDEKTAVVEVRLPDDEKTAVPSTGEPPIAFPASPAPVSTASHLPVPIRVTVPGHVSGPQRAGVEVRLPDDEETAVVEVRFPDDEKTAVLVRPPGLTSAVGRRRIVAVLVAAVVAAVIGAFLSKRTPATSLSKKTSRASSPL